MVKKFSFVLALLLLAAGCDKPPSDSPPRLPTTTMQIGSRQFTLEKATTVSDQVMGLRHRDSMPSDHGMIFSYRQVTLETMSNHDVRFPTDCLFVDPDGRVISIQHLDAYSDQRTIPEDCPYAIELNGGTLSEIGVKVGDRLTLPGDVAPVQTASTAPPNATPAIPTNPTEPTVRGGQPPLPKVRMTIGSRQFIVEEATTEKEQTDGLMRRDYLPADHGMIFIFPKTAQQAFWNHAVPFGLDNLFIDETGRIVSIQHMDAYSEANTDPVVCRYVIELNTGVPAACGVKVGDQLTIPDEMR